MKEANEPRNVGLRKARVFDVGGILSLVNAYATSNVMLPRTPGYVYENIRDFVVVEANEEGADAKTIACGSLHVLGADIGEIRSLATDPRFQRRGLGTTIVRHLMAEARQLGIERVFVFTLDKGFFERLGFRPVVREQLPVKVWGECADCPKYANCDEIGLIVDVDE